VNHTPFLQSLLLEDFGKVGVNRPAFHAVLARTYVAPPGCAPTTIKLLTSLCWPPNIIEIDLGREEEFTKGWRKAWEQTALSPSKVHFGHCIAWTFNPIIAIINAKMADWPQHKGRPLQHWTKGLNVMLEKIPGNCNLELHIIVLFEADFNYNNKHIGWAVMVSMEKAGLLAQEQYGSRRNKLANLQCLNKCLLYDLIRFRCQPLALCSNNAKSCYNRIVLTVVALCLCQVGTMLEMVASMVQTIHGMRHLI